MNLVLGVALGTCEINLKRQSRQSFGINWFNDTDQLVPSDLAGVTMTIILGTREAPIRSWVSQNTGNQSKWTLDAVDSLLAFDQYAGHMLMDDGAGEVLLFRVQAIVEE